jgi:predicted CoA-substrate-specific enzyme activase
MLTAGCDVGSLTAKALILDGDKVVSTHLMQVKSRPEQASREVMKEALSKIGSAISDIAYCVGTGYGRERIPFAQETVSEIACHGRGAQWLQPTVRTIIDVGGQDAKAIRLDGAGAVVRYVYNDKCASGTGRFLEVMAEALEIRLEDMGAISLASENPVRISNQCVVFAETEVISLVNGGKPLADVVSGLHRAMAGRIASLVKGIGGVELDVAMSGGVAKNIGIYSVLEKELGVKITPLNFDTQIVGALGAALFAKEALAAGKRAAG